MASDILAAETIEVPQSNFTSGTKLHIIPMSDDRNLTGTGTS